MKSVGKNLKYTPKMVQKLKGRWKTPEFINLMKIKLRFLNQTWGEEGAFNCLGWAVWHAFLDHEQLFTFEKKCCVSSPSGLIAQWEHYLPGELPVPEECEIPQKW